jgi:uncharacterized damage-inducible protein DinB
MTLDMLKEELDREAGTTRRLLAALPDDRLDWRPHARSFTARGLASHIVECFWWGEAILTGDQYDFDPVTHPPYEPASVQDVLARFDTLAASCREALGRADVDRMMRPWRMKVQGRVHVELPRVSALRDFLLNHVIHHRGQLSVYLRLLDVPVPGAYGPSADQV